MTKNTLIIATANTHVSQMLEHPDGLKPFIDKNVDVLLLQEVLKIDESTLLDRLSRDSFKLVSYAASLGLAIATNNRSRVKVVADQIDKTILRESNKLGSAAKLGGQSFRFRERGMLGAHLLVNNRIPVTVATTHPVVFIRALSRHKQIKAMGNALQEPFYNTERLIVGGDMNHYPSPRKIDIKKQDASDLKCVVLSDPSWRIEGSRHEWMAQIGSIVTGRTLSSFDAELNAILYRGVDPISTSVMSIESDHEAIITEFQLF